MASGIVITRLTLVVTSNFTVDHDDQKAGALEVLPRNDGRGGVDNLSYPNRRSDVVEGAIRHTRIEE